MSTPSYQIPDEMMQQLQYRALNNAGLYPTAGAGAGVDAAGTSGATGLASLLGRVPGINVTNPAANGLMGQLGFEGPTALGGTGELGLRALAGRALPGLAVAEFGPKAINAIPVGNQDQKDILGNVVAGAGLGAAAGAPFEGVGAIPGAVIGGGIGLAKGLFEQFGGDSTPSTDDYRTTLAKSAQQLSLDPTQYTAAFDLLTKSGADPKQLTAQLAQQLLTDAQTKAQQQQVLQQQTDQRAGDQKFALALQAQAQQFFTPYVNNIITAGQSQAELLKSQAQGLPAPYRDVLLNQAQQSIGQSQRLAGAYAAQSAMLPSQYMMSADIKRQQQLAQLQYQQAVINAQQGGGGSQGFNQLAQQLAGAGTQATGG